MLSRSLHSSALGRAAASRRLRRRNLSHRLYCGTNGCASFLEPQPELGLAVCPVCGYRRRLD
jgi:hypothetical protein